MWPRSSRIVAGVVALATALAASATIAPSRAWAGNAGGIGGGLPQRWVQLSPPTSPGPGSGDAMAYDAATKQIVLLDAFAAGTWGWNGTTWTRFQPADQPFPRLNAGLAYDAATRQLILFGGRSPRRGAALTDTWSWDGSTWTQLHPATAPSDPHGMLAYDPATAQLLWFGVAGTWSWTGTNWVQLHPATSPSPRWWSAVAFDRATSQLVLFGGLDWNSEALLSDTWTWTGRNWTKVTPAISPSPRYGAGAAYDALTGQFVLEGGFDSTNGSVASDTWVWSGATWMQLPGATVTPGRGDAAVSYDSQTGQLLLFGGSTADAVVADTWLWTPLAVQTFTLPRGMVGVPYSASLTAVAGTAPYTWSIVSGQLPQGLRLSNTGVISGAPTAPGTATFVVKVIDSAGFAPHQATRTLTLTVNPLLTAGVWVGNGANSDINAFPLNASGNVTPTKRLAGPLTQLNGVGGLAFDSAGNLYVASTNNNAVLVFAAGSSGNVAPMRVLQGPDTGLATPHGVTLDPTGRIYVTNFVTNTVTVYPPGAGGDQAPIKTITGDATGLSGPWGVQVDPAGRIWVANYANASLTAYAPTADGNFPPVATISGSLTKMVGPQGLAQDGAGNLLVADFRQESVYRFREAPPYGNVNPTLTINPDGGNVAGPHAVDTDAGQRVYVADQQFGVNVYAPGAVFPSATISGTSTDVKAPDALAVAPPMRITTRMLPEAAFGRRYSARVFAILGDGRVRWTLTHGRLPRGLTFNGSGQITGTPRTVGRYRFTVKAADASRPAQTAERTITLAVARAPTISSVQPSRGPARGGSSVTIDGTGFATTPRGTIVAFGRVRSPRVTCRSRRRCIVRTPPGVPGTVAVTVGVGELSSSISRGARYTYTGR